MRKKRRRALAETRRGFWKIASVFSGARYIAKAPWTPHAVVDGNLVTGQQNHSASVTADALLKQLAVQKQVAATI